MGFDLTFFATDHRLIGLAMVVVLAVAGEIGFRAGSRRQDAPEAFRSLMSGIAAILFLIMDINRPQRGTFTVGIDTLDRTRATISGRETP